MNSKFFTILAIDDNQLSLVVLKTLLSDAFPKATFISALSGKEGIALFRAKKPDIVLLDIVMPEMDGYEVCTILKSDPQLKHIPVVMLTALSVSGASRLKALESGADAFLSHPLDESELTVQIKTMIRLKESDERKHAEKERLENQVRDRTEELQERKKAEAALLESHRQLLDIIDFLPDATFVIDNEKKVIAWNKAMEVMTGVQKQDMIGKGDNAYAIPFYGKKQKQLLDLIDIDNEELKARYSNVSRNGLSLNAEIFAPALYSGKGAHISIKGAPLFNNSGERVGSIESIRDITDRKQSERALQESEERFHLLFDKAPLGYQSLDFDGNIIEVNQQWIDTLGYSRNEVIGKWFGDFLSPAHQEGFHKRFPIFKAKGKIHSEFEMVHKNGDILFIAFEGTIGNDLNGEFKQTHCILKDITESKRAADALRESEKKYRFMFANNPQPMWIYDLKTLAFLEINEAAINLYGYSRKEFLHMTLKDIRPPEDIAALLKDVELTRNAYNLAGEWRHLKKSGEFILVEVTSHSVISNGSKARHVLIKDITERKKMEEALMNSLSLTKAALESIQNGILIVSEQGTIIKSNAKFAEMWNIPDEILASGDDKTLINSILEQLVDPDGFTATLSELHIKPDVESFDMIYFKDGRIFERISKPMYLKGVAKGRVWSFFDITESLHAKEALSESEALYRNLVLRLPDGVYKSTHEGKFVDVNPAMVKMLGYESKEELMAIDIKSELYFEPADRESAVLQEKLVEMGIYRLKKKDGSEIWIEDHGWYNTDDKLNILFHEGIMRDITERKHAEDAIQKERILLRTLIDNLPNTIFAKDKEGHKILANLADIAIIGYTSEAEIIGKTDLELFPGKIGERGYADDLRILQTGEPSINREEDFIDKEGKHRFLLTSKIPLFDQLGEVTGLVGIGHDITEQKHAEEELRKLSRAVEQNPVAIIITDSDGTIEYVNPKFTELTGYTREEAIGKNPSISKSDTTTKEQYKQLWDTINSGGEWHGELRNKNKNGEIYFESVIISPISDESGRITHFLASMEDISRRKQAEEDIRQKAEELAISNEHLTRFNRLAIGREMRLIEIKKYCNQLAGQLGIELPYPLAFLNDNKNIIDGKDITPDSDDVEMKAQ